MKSDLFEAIETLRAWYLQDHQDKDRGSEGYQIEGGSKRRYLKRSGVVAERWLSCNLTI
jgi:hypothetical protein